MREVRKPTLKEMAQILGVSTASISNAFNRPDQLSEKLRERILSECQAQGYTGPNATARSLRTGKSGILGIMLADSLANNFSDPVANQFLEGIAEVLDEQQVTMLLLPASDSQYQRQAAETIPDGFVIYGLPEDERLLQRLAMQGKPIVTVDFTSELPNSVSVVVVDSQGARDSALHAINDPTARLAVLGLRLTSDTEAGPVVADKMLSIEESFSRRRLEGYREALQQLGRELKPEEVWHTPRHDHQHARELARQVLTQAEPPQVLLCMSDRIALGAMEVASELGLKVPEQLRIVGFDDIPEAGPAGLTTVHQPLRQKGRIVAELLLQQRQYEPVVLETEVVVRRSCP